MQDVNWNIVGAIGTFLGPVFTIAKDMWANHKSGEAPMSNADAARPRFPA